MGGGAARVGEGKGRESVGGAKGRRCKGGGAGCSPPPWGRAKGFRGRRRRRPGAIPLTSPRRASVSSAEPAVPGAGGRAEPHQGAGEALRHRAAPASRRAARDELARLLRCVAGRTRSARFTSRAGRARSPGSWRRRSPSLDQHGFCKKKNPSLMASFRVRRTFVPESCNPRFSFFNRVGLTRGITSTVSPDFFFFGTNPATSWIPEY